MNSKKKIALVGKGVLESGRFGKMTPTLDDENCDPQLAVESKEFNDIVYVVRSEYPILKLYVFWRFLLHWITFFTRDSVKSITS